MDAKTAQKVIDRLIPGDGNVQNGPVRLSEGMYWVVPFKNSRHGELQAFFKDREVRGDEDLTSVEADLEQSIGSALLNCQ